MDTTTTSMRVSDLLDLWDQQMMYPNPEYQRGEVWSKAQQKLLIDSILRGYSIPSFHLHLIEQQAGGLVSQRYEVIDGQQRLKALSRFRKGAFKLLDPRDPKPPRGVLFTNEAKAAPCDWANRSFDQLDEKYQDQFLDAEMIVVNVTTDSTEAVRDLFIRQQGGTPLKPQEIRDAWPGEMTKTILRLGGKTTLDDYPGHDFFVKLARQPGSPAGRQMAAQMLSLLIANRKHGRLRGIQRQQIDQFYYDHMSMASNDKSVKRFQRILDELLRRFDGRLKQKLVAHEAISLMLLVDEWIDGHTRAWLSGLPRAFFEFRRALAEARQRKKDGDATDEYWLKYGIGTQTRSDDADTIQGRYEFFRSKMKERLRPIPKDPRRTLNDEEKEAVFLRQRGRCFDLDCDQPLNPDRVEYHHRERHSEGGKTDLGNVVAVCPHCHPKGERAEREFEARARRRDANGRDARTPVPISQTDGKHEGLNLDGDLAADIGDQERRELLETMFERYLTERERKTLVLYYGLDGGERMQLEELGSLFGVTRERVRQMRDGAFEKLRASPNEPPFEDLWSGIEPL